MCSVRQLRRISQFGMRSPSGPLIRRLTAIGAGAPR